MKLTEQMLRDMVQTDKSVPEIGDLLTMVGFEIEEIIESGGHQILDVNIMANRGDGASVLGLAREILAKDTSAKPTAVYEGLARDHGAACGGQEPAFDRFEILLESAECDRFSACLISGIVNGESPAWLQERLEAVGLRPISLLVDLTNYVMLEVGQPMHAYDRSKLVDPAIIVREARAGERLKTLDGIDRELNPGQLMICDRSKPIGVAGVMGGFETEVDRQTTVCLLESAHFDHRAVRRTRKALGMQTDASYRFERYVDPLGTVRAMNRFFSLLKEACPTAQIEGHLDEVGQLRAAPVCILRPERCTKLLGLEVPVEACESYLTRLGCVPGDGPTSWHTPSWRIDLEQEDDLVEEIGRMHGYELIPSLPIVGTTLPGGVFGVFAQIDEAAERLVSCGASQIVSHSLRDLHPLDAPGERVRVRNPHSPEIAFLRNSHLPCLAEAAIRNGGKDQWIFETGKVFAPESEHTSIAILLTGVRDRDPWTGAKSPVAGFFTLKGVLAEVFSASLRGFQPVRPPEPDVRFHPTRHGVWREHVSFGQIHPDVAADCGLPADTFLAEVAIESLLALDQTQQNYRPVHRHPPARRDISFVLPNEVGFERVHQMVESSGGEELESQWLFDVYEGAGVDPGHRSLALGLQFRKAGNFTDEEANQLRDKIVAALESLGAKLR